MFRKLLVLAKKNFLASILVTALSIAGLGAGGFYLFKVQNAKNVFSEGCAQLVPKIGSNFGAYQVSSTKPNLFEEYSATPTGAYSILSGSLGGLLNLANESSIYSGSKKTTQLLEDFNANLDAYRALKGKEIAVELRNPYLSKLSAWVSVAKSATYLALSNPNQLDRLTEVGREYQSGWNSYMQSNFPSDSRNKMKELSTKIISIQSEMLTICRNSK